MGIREQPSLKVTFSEKSRWKSKAAAARPWDRFDEAQCKKFAKASLDWNIKTNKTGRF